MARLLVRELVWGDLEELGAYIATDNPPAAGEVVSELRRAFEQLAQMPQIGVTVKKIKTSEPLRVWLSPAFSNYLIFYRELSDGAEIVRVLHGARDLQRILKES
ncbi:MAG: type II toxin-antitoxin system RelE/ParE family toxin [Verrucomicrobiota bacterium]|nr:type II toxin-antitoxin system RelE/ParE family toxin [Verrucomicrobiota bacterium]